MLPSGRDFRAGCLGAEDLKAGDVESGGLDAGDLEVGYLVDGDVEARDFETLGLGTLDLGTADCFPVSSANAMKPLDIADGFVLASYCCRDSVPNVMLLAVFLGRVHASRKAWDTSAITPFSLDTYFVPSSSMVFVMKNGPLDGLAISDHGSWPDISVDLSKSMTSSEALHRT